MKVRIRLAKEKDVNNLSKIVGLNYSKDYEKRSKHEIKAMFKNYAIRPQYLSQSVSRRSYSADLKTKYPKKR